MMRRWIPEVFLTVYAFFAFAVLAITSTFPVQLSMEAEVVWTFAFTFLALWWFVADHHRRGKAPVMAAGMYFHIGFPIPLVCYTVHTRSWRRLGLGVLRLLGLLILAGVAGYGFVWLLPRCGVDLEAFVERRLVY